LIEVKRNGNIVESYAYDANGNRISETNTFKGITDMPYIYSIEDHLLTAGSDTYQFDADGFLTSKTTFVGTTTYRYSSRGELLEVTLPDGTVISYDYDPMGRRIAKKVNGTVVEKYLWSGRIRLLAVYDGNDNLIMRFNYADDRVPYSMEYLGQTYYLIYDQIGSLRAVVDSSGLIVKRIDYDSFGNVILDTDPSFRIPIGFAGGLYDADTGLVKFGVRDYDPSIGRWTAKDPIDFSGGDVNLYGYVGNGPVNFVDPLGLMGFSIGFEATGGLFGFGGIIGIYGNFSHDPNKPWYSGWSSSATFVLGGGAVGSVFGLSAGIHVSINNSCNYKQLEKGMGNMGRAGIGAFSIVGYRSPNGQVTGGGITIGPSIGYIGAFAGGTYTWTISGGRW